jgi:hypothetical protein
MRNFQKPVLSMILFSLLGGCANLGVMPTSNLTADQKLQQNRRTVQVATTLATKAALLAVDSSDAQKTAVVIAKVADAVVQATANDQLDLTQVRLIADKVIADLATDPRQKLIASQTLDTIAILVQDRIDADTATLSPTDKRRIAIALINSAAQGALDATAIFISN